MFEPDDHWQFDPGWHWPGDHDGTAVPWDGVLSEDLVVAATIFTPTPPWSTPEAERFSREAEFVRVVAFLDRLGYHIGKGYGDDEEVAYFGGYTQEVLAEVYAEPEREDEAVPPEENP